VFDHHPRLLQRPEDLAVQTYRQALPRVLVNQRQPCHRACPLLLQVLYGLRSEQQLMEQVAYNLLYRWFVGLAMDEAAWDATVYTKNRDRLLQGEVSQRLPVVVEGRINSKKRSGRE
jgi:hypothetical protein